MYVHRGHWLRGYPPVRSNSSKRPTLLRNWYQPDTDLKDSNGVKDIDLSIAVDVGKLFLDRGWLNEPDRYLEHDDRVKDVDDVITGQVSAYPACGGAHDDLALTKTRGQVLRVEAAGRGAVEDEEAVPGVGHKGVDEGDVEGACQGGGAVHDELVEVGASGKAADLDVEGAGCRLRVIACDREDGGR